jgi:phytanoyl-CoA hydroxylase
MIDDRARRSFEEQGHVAARRLFDADETAFLRDHFTLLRESGAYPGDVVGVEPSSDDPHRRDGSEVHFEEGSGGGPCGEWGGP